MCTCHVFGGISFPECCDYALRRTAIDNATNYDKEVAEMLLHTFYINDLYKSVESEEIVIQLIKDIEEYVEKVSFNHSPICFWM